MWPRTSSTKAKSLHFVGHSLCLSPDSSIIGHPPIFSGPVSIAGNHKCIAQRLQALTSHKNRVLHLVNVPILLKMPLWNLASRIRLIDSWGWLEYCHRESYDKAVVGGDDCEVLVLACLSPPPPALLKRTRCYDWKQKCCVLTCPHGISSLPV